MTLKECLDKFTALRPERYSYAQLTDMLNSFEGRLATNVLMLPPDFFYKLDYTEDQDAVLLLEHPYEDLYIHWLWAMTDFYNNEIDRYNDSYSMFTALYEDYCAYIGRVYAPAQHEPWQRVAMYMGHNSQWVIKGTSYTIRFEHMPLDETEVDGCVVYLRQSGTTVQQYTLGTDPEVEYTGDTLTLSLNGAETAALSSGLVKIYIKMSDYDLKIMESWPAKTLRVFPSNAVNVPTP